MIKSIPSAREARWPLITSISEEWGHSIGSESGFSQDDLRQAEERLGVPLPAALKEWYGHSGRRRDLWSCQDTFLSPDKLAIENGVLQFYIENQGVVRWGVESELLWQEDPAVLVSSADGSDLWQVENESISEFAIQMFVTNLKWLENRCSANGEASDRVIDAIARAYERLPLPSWHWPVHPTFLRGTSEVLIEQHGEGDQSWIWISARTERAFWELESLVVPLGMRWESSEGC